MLFTFVVEKGGGTRIEQFMAESVVEAFAILNRESVDPLALSVDDLADMPPVQGRPFEVSPALPTLARTTCTSGPTSSPRKTRMGSRLVTDEYQVSWVADIAEVALCNGRHRRPDA